MSHALWKSCNANDKASLGPFLVECGKPHTNSVCDRYEKVPGDLEINPKGLLTLLKSL